MESQFSDKFLDFDEERGHISNTFLTIYRAKINEVGHVLWDTLYLETRYLITKCHFQRLTETKCKYVETDRSAVSRSTIGRSGSSVRILRNTIASRGSNCCGWLEKEG